MNARVLSRFEMSWLEDSDPRDLRRWIMAAAIVVAIHLAAIAAYVFIHEPDEIGDDVTPISVEMSPSDDTVDQPEVAPVPEEQQKQVEQPPPGASSRRTARSLRGDGGASYCSMSRLRSDADFCSRSS